MATDTFDIDALTHAQERWRLTDTQMATFLGSSTSALRKWRSGTRVTKGTTMRLLSVLCLIETLSPTVFAALLEQVRTTEVEG